MDHESRAGETRSGKPRTDSGNDEAEAQAADLAEVYGNINVPPLIVHSLDEAEQLGSAWVEVDSRACSHAPAP